MAKRRKSKSENPLTVNVRVDVKADTPAYYVNYLAVSSSAYEIAVSAARVPNPLQPEQMDLAVKGAPMPVEATLQLVMPPLVARGLINALTDQLQKQSELFQTLEHNESKK